MKYCHHLLENNFVIFQKTTCRHSWLSDATLDDHRTSMTNKKQEVLFIVTKVITLLQILWRIWQWKNFENRPVFDEVMCRLRRLTFWPSLYMYRPKML